MNTKVLLTASAIVLGAFGVAGLFLPHEIAAALGVAPTGLAPLLVQLLASVLFAFSMVNWIARGSLMGGIYNRPVAVGNMTHFTIGGLAAVKTVFDGESRPLVLIIATVYVVFAIGFGLVVFRSPVKAGESA